MSLLNNNSLSHIINNIIEFIEGNTININQTETPLYSELKLVCSLWNKLIINNWKSKHIIKNILEEQIYKLELVLETGGCSACMCFLNGVSGGENQMAHYGGCFPDDYETEEEHQEKINHLNICNVKYIDYDKLKRKREKDLFSYQEKKKIKFQLCMDNNV